MKQFFTIEKRQYFATIHINEEGGYDNLEVFYEEVERRALNTKRMSSSEKYLISLVFFTRRGKRKEP